MLSYRRNCQIVSSRSFLSLYVFFVGFCSKNLHSFALLIDAKFFTEYLSEAGGDKFLTGEDMTVADIAAYQGFHYYRRGLADHVPKNCLDGYPEILGWMGRVESHPGVAAYLAKRG